jgi:hypothetical protein
MTNPSILAGKRLFSNFKAKKTTLATTRLTGRKKAHIPKNK